MSPDRSAHPRDDPWFTLPFGVVAAVIGVVTLAAGEWGIAVALLVNAVVALGRTAMLLRRPRRRPALTEALENAWLPLLAGGVLGATAGSMTTGSLVQQVGVGAVAGTWVALCIAGALAYYEHLLPVRSENPPTGD